MVVYRISVCSRNVHVRHTKIAAVWCVFTINAETSPSPCTPLRLRSQHTKVYPLFTYFPIQIQRPDMKHQNIVIIGGQSYDLDTIAVQHELMHQPRQLAILALTP
jgi:hypothetical protein